MLSWVLSMVMMMMVGWTEGSAKLQIGVKKRVENCEVRTCGMAGRVIGMVCWPLGDN